MQNSPLPTKIAYLDGMGDRRPPKLPSLTHEDMLGAAPYYQRLISGAGEGSLARGAGRVAPRALDWPRGDAAIV